MKGAILYKSKYGATRQYAAWLGDALALPLIDMKNASPEIISRFDFLLLGASVYIGKTMHKDWLERNAKMLQGKKLFHFIVCGTPMSEKQRLDAFATKNIPAILRPPGSVWFLPGRMILKKLSWSDRLMMKLGARLEKDPAVKKEMLADVDDVRQENLLPILKAVMTFTKPGADALQNVADAGQV